MLYAHRQRQFAAAQSSATERITGLAHDLEKSLAESNRLLAIRNFDRGQAAFEKELIGPGLLWMIESWRSAVKAHDPAWQHAARANLAAWQPLHPRLKMVFSHDSPVDAAAFSPDGKTVLTGGDDRVARLWDVATGEPIGQPLLPSRHGLRGRLIAPMAKMLRHRQRRTRQPVAGMRPPASPSDRPSSTLAKFGPWRSALTARRFSLAPTTPHGSGTRPRISRSASRCRIQDQSLPWHSVPTPATIVTASSDGSAADLERGPRALRGEPRKLSRQTPPTSRFRCRRENHHHRRPNRRRVVLGREHRRTSREHLGVHHQSAVRSVAVSPDGTMILTGGTDKTAQALGRRHEPAHRPADPPPGTGGGRGVQSRQQERSSPPAATVRRGCGTCAPVEVRVLPVLHHQIGSPPWPSVADGSYRRHRQL